MFVPMPDSSETERQGARVDNNHSGRILAMKVWELMFHLSGCPAGAEVNIGVSQTLNVGATDFTYDGGEVAIRSSSDVECVAENGDTEWLSTLLEQLQE